MAGTIVTRAALAAAAWLAAATALALSPARELFVPAAARGPGATRTWVTDLVLYNPGTSAVTARLFWLERETDNTGADPVTRTVAAGETLTLEDVILSAFGRPAAAGAIRIVADGPLVATSRIYNTGGGSGTFGQGFEGVPVAAALGPGEATDVTGLRQGSGFTTNLFAVNTAAATTRLRLELRDPAGAVLASRIYELPPLAAFYRKATDLGAGSFGPATLHAEVKRGAALVVASTIDTASGDPTTMEAWWPAPPPLAGDYFGTAFDADGVVAGGIWVRLDGEGRLTEAVWWVATDPGCVVAGGGGPVEPPVTLEDLAAGYERVEDWSAADPSLGTLTWTLRLGWTTARQHLTGTLSVHGEGWSGSPYPCLDGDHAGLAVELGRTAGTP